jgi:hypothetical protein
LHENWPYFLARNGFQPERVLQNNKIKQNQQNHKITKSTKSTKYFFFYFHKIDQNFLDFNKINKINKIKKKYFFLISQNRSKFFRFQQNQQNHKKKNYFHKIDHNFFDFLETLADHVGV